MTHRAVHFHVSDEDMRKIDGVWSSLRDKAQRGRLPIDKIIRELQRANEGHFTAPPLTYSDEECSDEEKGKYNENHKPASIWEQAQFWSRILPDADFSYLEKFVTEDPELHQLAEQWGVVPKPHLLRAPDYWAAYQHLVHTYFSLDADFPKIMMQWTGSLNDHSDIPRLTRKTASWHERITQQTPGDFLVFPFQFGAVHAGRSRRRAQICYEHNEIGLGPYEALCLLATHPNRIAQGALGFYCIGAKCGWNKRDPQVTTSAMYPGWFCPRFGYSDSDRSVFLDCGLPTYQSNPHIGSITAFELPIEEVAD
ncbi:MAG: hypothetical protein ACYC5G_02490 [Candidatus Doudnabacteria bacterium]